MDGDNIGIELSHVLNNLDWAVREGYFEEIIVKGKIAYILTKKGADSLKEEMTFEIEERRKK